MGLRRYKALWNKLKKENEKLKNVDISEYYIERLYGDKLLDQKPFLELLGASQIRINKEKDFHDLVQVYRENKDECENLSKVIKFCNFEIEASEIPRYFIRYDITPAMVEGLKKLIEKGAIVPEEDIYKFNNTFFEYISLLDDQEIDKTIIDKIVDISGRLENIFVRDYNIETDFQKECERILKLVFPNSSFGRIFSEEELKAIEKFVEIIEDEKIKERIKNAERIAKRKFSSVDLLNMYFENPEFFGALKDGKIDVEVLLSPPPREIGEILPFYGRIRQGRTKNIIDLAAYGREGRDTYHNSEYILYLLQKGRNSRDFSKIEKKVKAIEKFPFLRKKLRSLSEELRKWREEGKRYEGVNLRLGAYAKWNGDVNLEEAYNHKIEGDVVGFQMALNQGLKAPSHFGKKIKEFIDVLYSISKKAKEDPGIFYAINNWEEFSRPEREYLEEEIGTDELERVEKWIMNTPRGIYSEAPPLHNGNRGEDVAANNPRSYYMLDKVFRNYNGDKVGVIEYLVGNGSEDENIRIRVYDFKGKEEFAVEIYNERKKRFLDKKEVEEMTKQLENYTLPTLFLKDYFEKFTKQKIMA